MMLTPLSAQAIRDMRFEIGYSRRELADELGYSVSSIKDWERTDKKRRPMPRKVEMRFLSLVSHRRAEYDALRTSVLDEAA